MMITLNVAQLARMMMDTSHWGSPPELFPTWGRKTDRCPQRCKLSPVHDVQGNTATRRLQPFLLYAFRPQGRVGHILQDQLLISHLQACSCRGNQLLFCQHGPGVCAVLPVLTALLAP